MAKLKYAWATLSVRKFGMQQPMAKSLDTTKFPTAQQWDAKLIDDLLTGKPCCMSQESIWQTSRVTLLAQISAEQGGQPVVIN